MLRQAKSWTTKARRSECGDLGIVGKLPDEIMAKWNIGEKNGMWKDGRTIASNGYVLLRVGADHHLADVRGYAYEHRLVAEQELGRKLRKGELVHHINGDKTDNRPENLNVVHGIANHLLLHRTKGFGRRLPGESNLIIECKCGCGTSLPKYDPSGRPREYISGHNPRFSPTMDLILSALEDGPKSLRFLVDLHDSPDAVKVACSKLVKQGRIARLDRGIYGRSDEN